MEKLSKETVRASLLPYPAEKNAKSIPLAKAETTVGRAPSNDVHLSHGGVSRTHAVIARKNGRFILSDLKSRNGTFVNNERIEQAVLQHSDKILFGKRGFMFSIESDSTAEPPPEADIASVDGDTVTISAEELELSKLLTHSAETAISNFFDLLPPAPDGKEAQPILQAHKRLSFLYQLSENLRMPCDPEEILKKGLELIFEALPSAKRAAAMLRSDATGLLEVRAAKYRDPDPDAAVIPVSRTVLQQVVEDRVAIVSQNAQDDARFDNTEAFVVEDINSFVCVPLIQHERVIGAIYLDTDDPLSPFAQNDMEFSAAVANELALSIDNCRLQREALKNEKIHAIGLTITHLAHNIKNMLTVNRSAVDMMHAQLQAHDDENVKKNWHLVRQGFDRIADLTAEMLDYTQISAVVAEPSDINAAVVEEYELFKESLASEGIEVDLQLAPELPLWEMNQSFLQRAILNLVVNAKDALKGRKNGRIRISTEMDESSQLLIRVEDNGCGIGKGILNDVFELFYTTKGMEGSGVGLSMIQKFVESMGGRVSVTSTVGVGSIFTLAFPRQKSQCRPGNPNVDG
jgi:signal transduction histidine kinase